MSQRVGVTHRHTSSTAEQKRSRSFCISSLLKLFRRSGRTASDRPTPISDDRLGNSNGTVLCKVTRQPRATPSVNCVSSEWSYMLANASFFLCSFCALRKESTTYHQRRQCPIASDKERHDSDQCFLNIARNLCLHQSEILKRIFDDLEFIDWYLWEMKIHLFRFRESERWLYTLTAWIF